MSNRGWRTLSPIRKPIRAAVPALTSRTPMAGAPEGIIFSDNGSVFSASPTTLPALANENHVERQISVFHPHHHPPLGRKVEQHATLLRKKPAEHEAAFALRPAAHDFHGKFMDSAGGDNLKPFEVALRRRRVDGERCRTSTKKNQACAQSKEGQNPARQSGRTGGWRLIAKRYRFFGCDHGRQQFVKDHARINSKRSGSRPPASHLTFATDFHPQRPPACGRLELGRG